ncbi:MAG: ATP-dependent protease ATPase subunit HslU [Phycisphaerae bacterium]|nr:ATP-dependent protease ATPase subunit HslU [Phycisphaerae bacterium]
MQELTPKEVVAALDRYVIGQEDAKRAVAVAIRNRWRRLRLPEGLREEVAPKNIVMIGPTGVGKSEIARRLAGMINAPFIKVEATKYTEVGYHGRDVESIIRDLVELSIGMVRSEQTEVVRDRAETLTEERILDTLLPYADHDFVDEPGSESAQRRHRTREKLRSQLRAGHLEDREIRLTMPQKSSPVTAIATMVSPGDMPPELQDMFERLVPDQQRDRTMTVREARKQIFAQEAESLIDREKTIQMAIRRAEDSGIVFIDELDKVCGTETMTGPDVSRQGVQRDLLPIVEGSTVSTRHGMVRTDHILFIAAGAFTQSKPSDLMPELQGRFPIRVGLGDLGEGEFVRILTEPDNALIKQQIALLGTEGIELEFTEEAIREMAAMAHRANEHLSNIGARRLYTIIEKVVEDISFYAPDAANKQVVIDADYVRMRLADIMQDEKRSQYEL